MDDVRTSRLRRRLTRGGVVLLIVLGAALVVWVLCPALDDEPAANAAPRGFVIRGHLQRALTPGVTEPVTLWVASRESQTIWVTRLWMTGRLDADAVERGCSLRRDYELLQLPQRALPIELRPQLLRRGRRVLTRWTAVPSTILTRARPAVRMYDLAGVNQNACKGARIRLRFSGVATNRPPPRPRGAGSLPTPRPPSIRGGGR